MRSPRSTDYRHVLYSDTGLFSCFRGLSSERGVIVGPVDAAKLQRLIDSSITLPKLILARGVKLERCDDRNTWSKVLQVKFAIQLCVSTFYIGIKIS